MFHVNEVYRVRNALGVSALASTAADGCNGVFVLPETGQSRVLLCIVSDGLSWEHVSVQARQGKHSRIPVWVEMCRVKDLFWDAEDAVMQLHPPESTYVNNHPNVLHLWRPVGQDIPLPLPVMVGYKALGTLEIAP